MYLDFSLAAFEEITYLKLCIFKWENGFDFASEYLCVQLRNLEVVLMMQKVIPTSWKKSKKLMKSWDMLVQEENVILYLFRWYYIYFLALDFSAFQFSDHSGFHSRK